MQVSKFSSGKIVVRIHNVQLAKTKVDRTFILGENVRFIDYDRVNKGVLWIHYTDGKKEVMYNDQDCRHTKNIYDQIVQALQSTSTFIDYNVDESDSCCVI